jgi:hypothetical protein
MRGASWPMCWPTQNGRLGICQRQLVAAADELRELAIKHRQISAGVAAIKEMGILTGLRIDR